LRSRQKAELISRDLSLKSLDAAGYGRFVTCCDLRGYTSPNFLSAIVAMVSTNGRTRFRSSGFTVVELLVVCSICSILMALLLPAVQNSREAARRLACSNKLRQIGLALHNYEASYRVFPPGSQVTPFAGERSWSKSFGWTIPVLPFLEQQALYSQFDFTLDCQIHHRKVTSRRIGAFECPSDPLAQEPIDWRPPGRDLTWGEYWKGGWGSTSFLGVSGTIGGIPVRHRTDCDDMENSDAAGLHTGLFFGNSSVRIGDVLDGTSSTMLLGERGVTTQMGKWGGAGHAHQCPAGSGDTVLPGVNQSGELGPGGLRLPIGDSSDDRFWWSWHPGGSHFLLVDGSVRLMSYSINRETLTSLTTRAGHETVSEGW
jgi:prepilin-type processing-associated H-X9-DG protein